MVLARTDHRVYRKIYEKHHGKIPVGPDGKVYEIHHIDGNSNNNDPSNLVALTIQDHYDIHYKQQDWYACLKIAAKMNLSKQELSDIAKKNNEKMLADGTHPLQKRPDGTSCTSDRIKNGTFHILRREDGSSFTGDRYKQGTHPLANYTGDKHFKYDHTEYQFVNKHTGEKIVATQYDFSKMGKIDRQAISKIVHKRKPSYHGWQVIFDTNATN